MYLKQIRLLSMKLQFKTMNPCYLLDAKNFSGYYKCLIISLFCFFLTTVFGQNIPEKPSPMRLVNDFSQILSVNERTALEQTLIRYNDSSTTQIAIVTLPNLGTNEIAPFGVELFRKWGIGTKELNNGVLIFVCTDSTNRRANITTGYGMEGVLPDMICRRILDNHLVPNLQKGTYYQGFTETIERIQQQAKGAYKPKMFSKKQKKEVKPLTFGQKGLVFAFILFYILSISFRIMSGGRIGGGKRLKWRSSGRGRSFGGGSSGGGGASSRW
jgi:uncharacterized protein